VGDKRRIELFIALQQIYLKKDYSGACGNFVMHLTNNSPFDRSCHGLALYFFEFVDGI
jgi:hypothetical protein